MDGLPQGVSADEGEGTVTLTLTREAYPKAALYGAAYVFIDRCFVLLDVAAAHWVVTLSKKDPPHRRPPCASWRASSATSCCRARGATRSRRPTARPSRR